MTSLIISDFQAENLAGLINNDAEAPILQAKSAPFGQVVPLLMDSNHELWKGPLDSLIIWTQPQSISPAYARLLDYQDAHLDHVLNDVERFANLILKNSNRAKYLFIPLWVIPTYHRGYGFLDAKSDRGASPVLSKMNLVLTEMLSPSKNTFVLSTNRWIETAGKNAFNPKLWYMGKIAFGHEVFLECVRDVKAALRALTGQAKKLIILDLDDTLWGGIVGDDGYQNLKLGGHDHIGEAYVDFQRALKSFTRRGIILGIASKNDESVALKAINEHPEMILKLEDFAGWKINWNDKAQNIADLADELNLGLPSVVLIDDNPLERARVREALPEIFVPDWPQDPMLYKSTLLNLRVFDHPPITSEDRKRTEMYKTEGQRSSLKGTVGSLDEWFEKLEIKIHAEELTDANLPRAAQLLNKTNQWNLSTRRLSDKELMDWVQQDHHKLWVMRVADRFGDYGLTGIVSVDLQNDLVSLVDFVLSCRVIGRKVEETMLAVAVNFARRSKARELKAQYLTTEKNKPCLEFFEKSGFQKIENIFTWDAAQPYLTPRAIQLSGITIDG